MQAAKILVIGILLKLGHYALIGDVTQVAENYQTNHQTDWLGGTTVVGAIQGRERIFETLPVDFVG